MSWVGNVCVIINSSKYFNDKDIRQLQRNLVNDTHRWFNQLAKIQHQHDLIRDKKTIAWYDGEKPYEYMPKHHQLSYFYLKMNNTSIWSWNPIHTLGCMWSAVHLFEMNKLNENKEHLSRSSDILNWIILSCWLVKIYKKPVGLQIPQVRWGRLVYSTFSCQKFNRAPKLAGLTPA